MAMRMFKALAEFLTPVPTESEFQHKGTLTPEEFVLAGDLLVAKSPTWEWAAGDPKKNKDYLPPDKQYLITRRVHCAQRASDLMEGMNEESVQLEGDSDEWVNASSVLGVGEEEAIQEIVGGSSSGQQEAEAESTSSSDGEIPDLEDFEDANVLEDPQAISAAASGSSASNVLKTRTYDLTITYDLYYKCPRMWLLGYDEEGLPLNPKLVYQDIYAEYAKKTVTIEKHPYLRLQVASIHPCKHSEVMKKMVDRLAEENVFLRVDLYLFVFLKFMSAVIPTINYDFTFDVQGGGGSSSSGASPSS
mgnify:FL=1